MHFLKVQNVPCAIMPTFHAWWAQVATNHTYGTKSSRPTHVTLSSLGLLSMTSPTHASAKIFKLKFSKMVFQKVYFKKCYKFDG
jgi:hypothetical protein